MSRNIIIAFSAFKQSGKDTACDIIEQFLSEDFQYAVNVSSKTRLSFAQHIRDVIEDIFGIKDTEISDKEATLTMLKRYFKKNTPSYRDLTIMIGEGMKKLSCEQVWTYSLENHVNKFFKNAKRDGDNVFIIPDVRYKSELKMLNRMKKRGYEVYHFTVFRKEAIPDWVKYGISMDTEWEQEVVSKDFGVDRSECEWVRCNPIMTDKIINDGSLLELKDEVENKVMKRIWKRR